MRTVPLVRTVETAGATVGIVHTLDVYHQNWGQICADLEASATRARVGGPRAGCLSMDPDPGLLWGRPDIEGERTARRPICQSR